MNNKVGSLLDIILSNTFTMNDLQRRLGTLRSCVEAALFTDTEMSYLEECELYLREQVDEGDAKAIKEWGPEVLTAFSQNNVSAQIKTLQKEIESLPVLKIYLPFIFPEKEMDELVQWCRSECEPDILLDVVIDASVVGGCAFIAGDTYHDMSFTARLAQSPKLINNLLSSYAQK